MHMLATRAAGQHANATAYLYGGFLGVVPPS
jgi:hypothetical protein